MDLAYDAASIIASRAGAMSIAELALVGKPTLLVPSPHVAEDHQTKNARSVVDRQGAVMLTDDRVERDLGPRGPRHCSTTPKGCAAMSTALARHRPARSRGRPSQMQSSEFAAPMMENGLLSGHRRHRHECPGAVVSMHTAQRWPVMTEPPSALTQRLARRGHRRGPQRRIEDALPAGLLQDMHKESGRTVDHRLDPGHSRGVPPLPQLPAGRFHRCKRAEVLGQNQPRQACIGRRRDPRKNHHEHPVGPHSYTTVAPVEAFLGGIALGKDSNLLLARDRRRPLDGGRSRRI